MTKLFTLFRREDGIALPTAMMVLTLCLLMTAVVAEGADQLSTSSGTDQRGKRALAAADGGVDVAIRRLRALPDLDNAHCLTTTGVPPTGGVCPSSAPESLGGGASFSYVVSPVTTGSAPAGCYQVPGQTIPAHYLRRCITATGRVGTETRRVQEQVVTPPRGGQWMGILGLDSVRIINSAQLSACDSTETPGPTVGSNVSVTLDNSAVMNAVCPSKVWGIQMPAGATPSIHWGAQPSGQIPTSTAPEPFAILPPPRSFDAVSASNDNAAMIAGATASSVQYPGGANARNIRVLNGGSLKFNQGGDLILCSLAIDNSGNLDFSTTQKTRIFIDSATRPGSTCNAGSTGFTPGFGSRFNWPTTVPDTNVAELMARSKNVEIYIYDQYVNLSNTVRLAALIQNERNTTRYINGSMTWGAVASRHVILENSGNFQRPDGLTWPPDGPPYRSAGWTQCRSLAPPPATPHAGC